MRKLPFLTLTIISLCVKSLFSHVISPNDSWKIGERIWKNECEGTKEGLASWNKGENFPSLGIGHFIWYPQGKKEAFQETFPDLLVFLKKEGVTIPEWLKRASGCPWRSREEFYQKIDSNEMKSLREFLFETKNLQASFIVNRLEKAFVHMMEDCPRDQKAKITATFRQLSSDARGLYALIDYLNFKGEGTSSLERYNGKGWGLLQVLGKISTKEKPLDEFVVAAKSVLIERVKNAPPERQEDRWLKGWINRVEGYLLPF